jgi:arylsulfatase A-like enzyme
VDFIERHVADSPEQPFFLYLTPSAPHRPCMAPDITRGKSQAGPRGDLVMVVDWVVGEIVDVLERLGLTDNTLLILTSDNGAQPYDVDGNDHGHKSCGDLRGFKSHIWDGGHREPFIARWPGRIAAGSVCKQTVCLADLMATCADIVGDTLPENAGEDSVSMLSALLKGDDAAPVREAVVHHSLWGMFSIRQGRWKLILGRDGGGFDYAPLTGKQTDEFPGQLYDMEADPAETTNLYAEQPDVVGRLSALLQQYKDKGRSVPAARV